MSLIHCYVLESHKKQCLETNSIPQGSFKENKKTPPNLTINKSTLWNSLQPWKWHSKNIVPFSCHCPGPMMQAYNHWEPTFIQLHLVGRSAWTTGSESDGRSEGNIPRFEVAEPQKEIWSQPTQVLLLLVSGRVRSGNMQWASVF